MQILKKFNQFLFSKTAFYSIILLGIFLRLKHFFDNRSLWLDEAIAAISIINRSYSQIWNRDYIFRKVARPPLFFSMTVKNLVDWFGNSDYILRFFPLVCGIAALLVFQKLVRRYYSKSIALMSTAFLAISGPAIYYSAELKQYSTDMLIALLLFWGFERIRSQKFTWKTSIISGILGAIVIWLSNASMFMLAGLGLTILLFTCIRKHWQTLPKLGLTFGLWLISFIILYKATLSNMVNNEELLSCFPMGFCPLPLKGATTFIWLKERIYEMFTNPVGIQYSFWAFLLCVIGFVRLLKIDAERGCALLFPILFTLLASFLHKYPFIQRLLLFLIPYVILLLTNGIMCLGKIHSHARILPGVITLFFLIFPIQDAAKHLFIHRYEVKNRQILTDVFATNYQPHDFIFMSPFGRPPFWHYATQHGYAKNLLLEKTPLRHNDQKLSALIIGNLAPVISQDRGINLVYYRKEYNFFNEDYQMIRMTGSPDGEGPSVLPEIFPINLPNHYKRVWVFLSNIAPEDKKRDEIFLNILQRSGKQILKHQDDQIALYLFDLRLPPDQPLK